MGMTGQWREYPWLGAIPLTSIAYLFLVQFSVERKYGYASLSILALFTVKSLFIVLIFHQALEGNLLPHSLKFSKNSQSVTYHTQTAQDNEKA